MPQDYTAVNPQTGETVRWDGKAWAPVPKPNPFESDVMSGMGFDPAKVAAAGGAGAQWGEVGKEALTGAGSWLKKTAMDPYHITDPISALATNLESALREKNPGKIMGALASVSTAMEAPEKAAKVGSAAVDSTRPTVRSVLGVGKDFEARMAAEHQTAVTDYNAKLAQIKDQNQRALNEGRQSHEAVAANIEKQNAEARAAHQEKIQAIKQKYAGQVAETQAAAPGASATQSAAETKSRALGDSPRSGPAFQRLQGMTNQVYGMIDNLQDRIRSEYNKRWRAFDTAVDEAAKKKTGEPAQVDWTPVQQAVKDAETNILKGSPESIAIFRNIMKESPQLDEASVFKTNQSLEATGNLKEMLRNANPNMRRQILADLHRQGINENDLVGITPESSGLPGQGVKIPFADARGYYTELGGKLSGAQLPGDVYQAINHVREAVDKQVTGLTKEHVLDAVYKNLKRDWRDYKQAFDEPEAAIYQFDKLDTPEKRIDFLSSGKGQNLIDRLSHYRGFGADPNLPGRVRSLVRQLRDLPSEKKIPSAPDRPSFPKKPEPAEFPRMTGVGEAIGPGQAIKFEQPPTAPEPLDITRKRVEQLEHMAKTWSSFQPNQARWFRAGVSQRSIGRLLSNPAFREWVAKEGK